MDLFHKRLDWQVKNAFVEKMGTEGTLGRTHEGEVILKPRLLYALKELNPGLPTEAYIQAWEKLSEGDATRTLPEINHEKYEYLRQGVPVTYQNDKGELVRDHRLRVFNFAQPEKNDFLAVQQMTVLGKSGHRRRPDIIGFVNGIPLLFIELKAHHRKLQSAYDENLTDYKDTIPHLFYCNAFVILSNGLDSKIGSITSKFTHFHDWKRINEEDEGIVSLDIILRGVCDKAHFLDLFEHFILFDQTGSRTAKLIARNHQFLGVNKAFKHFLALEEKYKRGEISLAEKQKLGVFWHTQGSGKSYSMVFFCEKIHRQCGGYTFVMVTDRTELDKQLYGTFSAVGKAGGKEQQAGSGEALQKMLKESPKYIFTLIHKFNFQQAITERENVIVISDEAHRTQGGSLAMNLRMALPHAGFMGFTGTPLFKDDEITRRIFGDYVSVYDFKRSVEDGATVPLYYENRGEKLQLNNPELNDEIRAAIEAADLDTDQEAHLEKVMARDYPILTAEKRLRAIAKDVVWHFNHRGYLGKALMVCLDKLTAVRMYNYIGEEWHRYLMEETRRIEKMTDEQEALVAKRKLVWSEETEVAVVVSDEQNEVQKFRDWGLDILPHREKMRNRDLETEFKQEDHPFRLAIVCAMWITGFDVPTLSTLYLDKPLRAHTLMQTIARANRTHEGKNNGLIVDYIETYKNLLDALAIYAIGGGASGTGTTGMEAPVKPIEELVADLSDSIGAVEAFLWELGFDLGDLVHAKEGLEVLAAIGRGVEAVYVTDEAKAKFGVMAREVFRKYKAVLPNTAVEAFREQHDAIDAIYRRIEENTQNADIGPLIRHIQGIVDQSVESLNAVAEPSADYGVRVDLSQLDFEIIKEAYAKTTQKNTMVQVMRRQMEDKLAQMIAQNPARMDYYERYQQIIEEYNQGKERVTIEQTFQHLMRFWEDLSDEAKRASREGLTEEYLAIYDLLLREKQLNTQDKNKVKAVSKELLDHLKATVLKVAQWDRKPQTAAAVHQAITDYLFEHLPYPSYDDQDLGIKTTEIFNYLLIQFGDAA